MSSALRDRLTSMGIRLATWPFVGFDGGEWFHGRDANGVDYSFCLDTGRWIRWSEEPVIRELHELSVSRRPPFLDQCLAAGFEIISEHGGPFDNWFARRSEGKYLIHVTTREITCYSDRPISTWTLDDFLDRSGALAQREEIERPPRVVKFFDRPELTFSGANAQQDLFA